MFGGDGRSDGGGDGWGGRQRREAEITLSWFTESQENKHVCDSVAATRMELHKNITQQSPTYKTRSW